MTLFIITCVKSIGTPSYLFAMPWLFAAAICPGDLCQVIVVGIWVRYLPQLFAVGLFTFFLCERIIFLVNNLF